MTALLPKTFAQHRNARAKGRARRAYRSLVKNVKPGEEAVLVLAPAQIFTGTVRYEDTGEPAPHARLTILSAQQKYGGMIDLRPRR